MSSSQAQSSTISVAGTNISIPTGLFINNEFVNATGGKTFGVENPTTGKELLQVQEGMPEDVDVAVKAARSCFDSGWSTSDPTYRASLLNKFADLLEQNQDEIVAIEMLDTGKTYGQALNVDFRNVVGTLRYFAGWADKVLGQVSFNVPKTFTYTRREPIGVCGQIIPWK